MAIQQAIPESVEWNGKKTPVYPMETVSFERLLSQEPAELEKVVRCCETEGFFYLDLQGIDGRRMLEDQQKTLDLMHRFFESPIEVKNQYGLISPHLGYVTDGKQSTFVCVSSCTDQMASLVTSPLAHALGSSRTPRMAMR